MWARFCETLGAAELAASPDYRGARGRLQHRERLQADINRLTAAFPVRELVERLNAVGVPCGAVQDVGAAFDSPQVRHLKMATPAPHPELGDVNLVRSPINLSRFPHAQRLRRAAPDPGEDGRSILSEIGIDADEVLALRERGVIG